MRVVLIDCENLTSARQRGIAFRWRGFERVELFGRTITLVPWRAALAAEGIAVAAEWPVADDAPPQLADALIAARAESLAAEPPSLLAIASNDSDFIAPLARLAASGVVAVRQADPGAAELLRLVVEYLAGDGWADAAVVGTMLAERFGFRLKGRLDALAAKADLAVERHCGAIRLGLGSLP